MTWDEVPESWAAAFVTSYAGATRLSYRRGRKRPWLDVCVEYDSRNRAAPSHYDVDRCISVSTLLFITSNYTRRAVDISHESPRGNTTWLFALEVAE